MLEQALEKIRTEMETARDQTPIQVVGEFLIQHLTAHPECAEKILAEDKTIVKSLDAMREEARKRSKGNYAVLTDTEGFSIVLRYFGIDGAPRGGPTAANPLPAARAKTDFDVKLDDFL